MIAGIVVRPEEPGDKAQIYSVVKRAFGTARHSDGTEQDLVNRLRDRDELELSLVAVIPGEGIQGHVAFSPVLFDGRACGWLQMAPVSVEPVHHGKGVGSALIQAGIACARLGAVNGIGVLGNPAYYERFGFAQASGFGPDGEEAAFFRALVLRGDLPRGTPRYASAFY